MNEDLINKLRIMRTPGIGALTYRYLLQLYKNHAAIIDVISVTHNVSSIQDIQQEYSDTINNGWNYLCSTSIMYPYSMNAANSSPIIIYKGNIKLLQQRCIGVVGTRQPSLNGMSFCKKIVNDLLNRDFVIVSGLADGIDTCSHEVNLSRTIGILAGGCAFLEPNSLACKIINAGGLVITEQSYNTPIQKFHFPARNKIIAAISSMLVVIEAPSQSGSLNTIRNMHDLKKQIYIMPGRPNDLKTEGGNAFLQAHMNKNNVYMLLNSEDIINNHYNLHEDKQIMFSRIHTAEYDNKILELLTNTPISISNLSEAINIDIGLLLHILVKLEMQNKILIYNYTICLKN